MFDDLFVRMPFEILAKEKETLLNVTLNPEIYINGAVLNGIGAHQTRRFSRILKRFAAHTLHAPFLDLSPGAADPQVGKVSFTKMAKMIALAQEWNSTLIVMHFNYDPIYYRGYFSEWLARAGEFFQKLADRPDPPTIALENIAEPNPNVARQLFKTIDRPSFIHCFDFGHHHVFATISFEEWLKQLDPQRHIHFHFHDNDGSRDSHSPLGQGRIDWKRVRKRLSKLKIGFSVALESHSLVDLNASLAYYRKLFLPH